MIDLMFNVIAASMILSAIVCAFVEASRLKRRREARRAAPAVHYPRPQGVAIRRVSGEVVPVEVAFAGLDHQGLPVWRVDTPVDMAAGDTITVKMLPARTGIAWPVPIRNKEEK